MEYSIITLIAVLLTTLLVYRVANHVFHLNLRWKPLLLCAACALFMSLVIPRFVVTMAGLAGTIGVLAIFAIIFAYFVAYFDENAEADSVVESPLATDIAVSNEPSTYTLMQFSATPLETSGETQLDKVAAEPELDIAAPSEIEQETVAEVQETPLAGIEFTNSDDDDDETEIEIIGEQVFIPDMTLSAPNASGVSPDASAPELVEESIPAESPVESAFELPVQFLAEPASEIERGEEIPEMASSPVEESEPEAEIAASVAGNDEHGSPMETGIEETTMEVESVEEKDCIMPDLNVLPESFDDLLDMAFNLLEEGSDAKAAAVFRHALKLYPDSEAAPFIATQIGSIFKSNGAYDDAIQVLTEARSLPAFKHDATLEEEFINSVALLRITKNILLDHRMGFLPYERIPEEIRKEIDSEFHEWRNLA